MINAYQKMMKYTLCIIIACVQFGMAQEANFEETATFYPHHTEQLKQENAVFGYLTTPENWNEPQSKKIKVAFSILKNYENKENAEAVIFLQGGPGASSVQSMWTWLYHPLRKDKDIIFLDVRGTGFSEPRLCPDLGNDFLQILAKNQSEAEDEKQKVLAALSCKQELIKNGIDIAHYNSLSVANDLNALRKELGYSKWHVYGVSYGTYMAQVYANEFPQNISSLVLDSSIPDISTYYTENTDNFMGSLQNVFDECKNNPECNQAYPDLEKIFFKTIADLEKNPITVPVEKRLIENETFTYNAEDFKVAIQQALYNKQLVEVIPILIYQFHDRNEATLGNLVSAFSSLLTMDYGVYYCVSCNETLPKNNLETYNANAAKYKSLGGGIAFYKSDFAVCDKWNTNQKDSLYTIAPTLSNLSEANFPVLVIAGEYDPITPQSNGEKTANTFKNASVVNGSTYGHTPGFTYLGNQLTTSFINNPTQKPSKDAFKEAQQIAYVNDIKLNSGISGMGQSLQELNPVFIVPLAIALFVLLLFIILHSYKLIKKKYNKVTRYNHWPDKIVRILGIITSVIGLMMMIGFFRSLSSVSSQNFYILAFGLPNSFNYLFIILFIFIGFLVITVVYYIIKLRRITDRSVVFLVVFSNLLLLIYMGYWGVLSI